MTNSVCERRRVYMSGPSVREEIYFVHCARVNGDVWNIIDF